MKMIPNWLVLILAGVLAAAAGTAQAQNGAGKVRVLVITGGHEFETQPFFQIFKENPDITYEAVAHPNAHARLKADAAQSFDVLALYDMHQEITDEAKADLLARLRDGKGLV